MNGYEEREVRCMDLIKTERKKSLGKVEVATLFCA